MGLNLVSTGIGKSARKRGGGVYGSWGCPHNRQAAADFF